MKIIIFSSLLGLATPARINPRQIDICLDPELRIMADVALSGSHIIQARSTVRSRHYRRRRSHSNPKYEIETMINELNDKTSLALSYIGHSNENRQLRHIFSILNEKMTKRSGETKSLSFQPRSTKHLRQINKDLVEERLRILVHDIADTLTQLVKFCNL